MFVSGSVFLHFTTTHFRLHSKIDRLCSITSFLLQTSAKFTSARETFDGLTPDPHVPPAIAVRPLLQKASPSEFNSP